MRKLRLPLIVALFLVAEGHAQKRASYSPATGAGSCVLTQRARGDSLQRSAKGVYLQVLKRDPDGGGVMVGGSVFLNERKGLILRSNGKDLDGILVPRVESVQDFVYITRDVGWRLYTGTLYATIDGGACWREVFTHKGLNNIHFADRQNGWLTGLNGLIYRTNDGGASWHRQESGTEIDLVEMSSVDSLHAWALGRGTSGSGFSVKPESVLIATQDGGRTWQTLVTEETISLYTVSFVNSSEGWAIAGNNIVRTVDGGRTWEVQRSGDKQVWRSIFFLNPREGWVGGDGILHTKDGGATWKVQLRNYGSDPIPPIESLFFSDGKNGWAMTGQELLYTSDAGSTWDMIFNDPRIETAQR